MQLLDGPEELEKIRPFSQPRHSDVVLKNDQGHPHVPLNIISADFFLESSGMVRTLFPS